MQTENKKERKGIDFVEIAKRYEKLDNGQKAMMRRVKTPDELRATPAFYRLFPGERPHPGWLRVAYMLPCCPRDESAQKFSKQLVDKKISEMRIFQIARMSDPLDIEQLRRMAIQVKAKVNWEYFGKMVFYWNDETKRRFIEDFFIAQTSSLNKGE